MCRIVAYNRLSGDQVWTSEEIVNYGGCSLVVKNKHLVFQSRSGFSVSMPQVAQLNGR